MNNQPRHIRNAMRNEWKKTGKTPIQLVMMLLVPFLTTMVLFFGLSYMRGLGDHYSGVVYLSTEEEMNLSKEVLKERYPSFSFAFGDEEKAKNSIRSGGEDVAIWITDTEIRVYYDSSILTSSLALKESSDIASELSFLLEDRATYDGFISFLPETMVHDLSTEEKKLDTNLNQICSTIGMVLFLSMCTNAMTLSTGSITGEKERQTFDTLVLCPAPLRKILIGKVLVMMFQVFLSGIMGTLGAICGLVFWDRTDLRMIAERVGSDPSWIFILLLLLATVSLLIAAVFSVIASAFPQAKKTSLFSSAGMILISVGAMVPTYVSGPVLKYIPVANWAPVVKAACKHQTELVPVLCALGMTACLFGASMILSAGLWERSHE